MQLNFITLTLYFLGSVILCGAQSETSPTANANTVTELPASSVASPPNTTPVTDTTHPTESTATAGETTPSPATQTEVTDTATTVSSTPPPTESAGAEGLSSGAIAGIAIGSIAGVAAVGGGIFGALKYTGRI